MADEPKTNKTAATEQQQQVEPQTQTDGSAAKASEKKPIQFRTDDVNCVILSETGTRKTQQ